MQQFVSVTGNLKGVSSEKNITLNSRRIENLKALSIGCEFTYEEYKGKIRRWKVKQPYATILAAIKNADANRKMEFAVLTVDGITISSNMLVDLDTIIFVSDNGSSTTLLKCDNGSAGYMNIVINDTYANVLIDLNYVEVDVDSAQSSSASGTVFESIQTDRVNEKNTGAGVIIDGVWLKDNNTYTDVISERTSGSGVSVDGVQCKDGKTTTTAPNVYNTGIGVVAFATGGQANAVLLTAEYNEVSTCVTAGDSVKLPDAVLGLRIIVKNNGATGCDVFPNTNDSINSLGANVAVRLMPNCTMAFFTKNSIIWETTTEIVQTSTVEGETTFTIRTSGSDQWRVNASGTLLPLTDKINDIGNLTVNPRDIHASGSLNLVARATTGYSYKTEKYTTTIHTTTNARTNVIQFAGIPVGAKIKCVQLRNDTAIVGVDDATGLVPIATFAVLATGGLSDNMGVMAVAKNTKFDYLWDDNATSAKNTAVAEVTIDSLVGNKFTAGGLITMVVYYEEITSLTSVP